MCKYFFEKRKGFTLMELIVVIVIMGILLMVAIPRLGSYLFAANFKKAQFTHQTIVYSMKEWSLDNRNKNQIPGSFTVANSQGKRVVDYIRENNREFFDQNIVPTLNASGATTVKTVTDAGSNTTYTISGGTFSTVVTGDGSASGSRTLVYDPLGRAVPLSEYRDHVLGF